MRPGKATGQVTGCGPNGAHWRGREARDCTATLRGLQPYNAASYFQRTAIFYSGASLPLPRRQTMHRACQMQSGGVQWAWPVAPWGPCMRKLLLVLTVLCACTQPPAPVPSPQPDASTALDPHTAALGPDPDAMPEPLRLALKDFRDKFACNNISGCPSERVLVGFGWTARPYMQQVFEKATDQATYRARAVRVIAELQDPQAIPFLRDRLGDNDPEVRAFAVYGLALADDRDLERLLPTIGRDDATAWMAPVRLSALWAAHRWGDRTAERAFVHQLAWLARQHMAVQGLTWGLTLCMRQDGPHCEPALPAIARHPNFLVRRYVAQAMAAAPKPAYAAGLVALANETAKSISEPAVQALRVLSGQNLTTAAEWRQWCAATGCEAAAESAITALYADASPTAAK